jgi:DNA-binding beta-propeller fold protein YncE
MRSNTKKLIGLGRSTAVKAPLFLLCTVACVMTLSVSSALASRGHAFSKSFAPEEAHALSDPAGVAVNEATGDVYVVDKGNNRVEYFNATGIFQGEFNGSGLLGEGEAAGSGLGEVPTGEFDEPQTIAVDNSCVLLGLAEPACKTADPSNGDVYVVDAKHLVVDKYTAGGQYVGQISENQTGRFIERLDGVAVNAQGAVFVLREGKEIDRYSNLEANVIQGHTTIEGLEPLEHLVPGFAVDGEGNFYVRASLGTDFVGRIAKISSSGKPLNQEVDPEKSPGIAVNQRNSSAVIDNVTTLGVFDPSGIELERLGEEAGAHHLTSGAGVAVNASPGTESIYAADAATGEVVVFGPVLPSAPTAENESASEISSEAATLEAEVDPRSEAGEGPTEYHFVYGPCDGAAGVESCAQSAYPSSAPEPEGQVSPDFEAHPVSTEIAGLSPNTTYHFKLVAHNERGPIEGKEATFTTQGPGGALTLPDDRGWELVSPPDKQGAAIEPIGESGVIQSAADGSAITYLANAPTEAQPQGAQNLSQILSRRAVASWSSSDISLPHQSATGKPVGAGQEYKFFNSELTLSAVQPFGQFNPLLSAEASESTAYLHDLNGACGSSCYRPLVTGKAGFANVAAGTVFGEEALCTPRSGETTTGTISFCGPEVVDATPDLSAIVLRSPAVLQVGAAVKQLYEWSGGQLSQVSVLPGGGSAPESPEVLLGLNDEAARGAISNDGSRVVWEAKPNLYVRDMSLKETVQLDEAEGCGGCTSGGGRFQFASADGSRIFFTDHNKLTSDSGAAPEGGEPTEGHFDLYECKVVTSPKLACEKLTDLTPKRVVEGKEEGANVQGSILGASEDGSIVYFVAQGVQSEAPNIRGESAIAGKPNLYVRNGTTTTFITTLAGSDRYDWNEALIRQPTRASGNGQFLELMSERSLTGYDNRDVSSGQPTAEVYLYDAASAKLRCASCDPTGARPVGIKDKELIHSLVGQDGLLWPEQALVAANVPGWAAIASGAQRKERYQPRYLNNEGRLFFNTANALVSQDSNGTQDVYEYEPPGTGSCTSESETFSSRSGGCVGLISSGSSAQESAFLDASESGDDVFFLTLAKLSPLDVDASLDVYDAHVCTSALPCITFPNVQSPPCTNEASCKATPTPEPAVFGAPPSATFQGLGNFKPVPAVKAKAKPLTRAQKFAAALKACKKTKGNTKQAKSKRAKCEKSARKKFGPVKRAKKRKGN